MEKHKNIPELRFPKFEDKWDSIQLNGLLEFKNGINASKEQFGSGVKFINVLDILNNDFIVYDGIIGSVDIDDKALSKNAVTYGDILFQRSSETREEVGTACVYLDKERTATFGGFVIRGKKIGEYEPVFLNHLLKTDSARKEITTRAGGSTRYNVGQETLASIVISIPTLPEQQKIASFFTNIDKNIFQLKQKKTLLEQYKNGVMQKVFLQEIRFRDDNGQEFPQWERNKLGQISNKKASAISANAIEENSGNYPIYGATGFLKNIDFFLEVNDYISIVKDGAGVGRLQYCDGYSSVLGTLDIIKPKKGINTYFLYLLIGQIDFTKYITGSTIPHIYYKDYSNQSLLIPSLKEQTKIAEFISAIDNKINQTQSQIEKAELWKTGLLQKMFV